MSRKHRHGKHLNRATQQNAERQALDRSQGQAELVQANLEELFSWYVARVTYYERKADQYWQDGNERLLESAAGKVQLFRYKAERLLAILA